MKVLSKNQLSNLNLLTQLFNELKILSFCKHPNIIALHALFEDSKYIYMVMELAEGGSLYSLIKSKPMDEPEASRILAQVIKGVSYLHSQNPPILHRDLKPENILIRQDVVKLCDFGWSSLDDQREVRNTYCGTPEYLSPEMILGVGHNEKVDVWSIGVLMYEIVTGWAPFTAPRELKDLRAKQRYITDCILNGTIVFDEKISTEAKSAIKILLHPKASQRPLAKDILNLDFFQKYL